MDDSSTVRQPMSAQRLAEIRQREQAASKGPWVHLRGTVYEGEIRVATDESFDVIAIDPPYDERNDDLDFLANARQDVPDLLDEVDRLTALLDEYVDKRTPEQMIRDLREAEFDEEYD